MYLFTTYDGIVYSYSEYTMYHGITLEWYMCICNVRRLARRYHTSRTHACLYTCTMVHVTSRAPSTHAPSCTRASVPFAASRLYVFFCSVRACKMSACARQNATAMARAGGFNKKRKIGVDTPQGELHEKLRPGNVFAVKEGPTWRRYRVKRVVARDPLSVHCVPCNRAGRPGGPSVTIKLTRPILWRLEAEDTAAAAPAREPAHDSRSTAAANLLVAAAEAAAAAAGVDAVAASKAGTSKATEQAVAVEGPCAAPCAAACAAPCAVKAAPTVCGKPRAYTIEVIFRADLSWLAHDCALCLGRADKWLGDVRLTVSEVHHRTHPRTGQDCLALKMRPSPADCTPSGAVRWKCMTNGIRAVLREVAVDDAVGAASLPEQDVAFRDAFRAALIATSKEEDKYRASL